MKSMKTIHGQMIRIYPDKIVLNSFFKTEKKQTKQISIQKIDLDYSLRLRRL